MSHTTHNPEVRGYTSYNQPASPMRTWFARIPDLCMILLLTLLGLTSLHTSPLPGGILLLLLATGTLYWFPQRAMLGVTLGDRLWNLKRRGNQYFQCDRQTSTQLFISTWVTTLSFLITFGLWSDAISHHPVWMAAEPIELEAYAPPTASATSTLSTAVVPFFYTLGAWPQTLHGEPIFYSVFYEKGPPTRFVGHISAHLTEHSHVVLEGPKTPSKNSGTIFKREKLRTCLSRGGFSLLASAFTGCLTQKENTLSRHLSEMHAIAPQSFHLKWFLVQNKTLAPEEQTQGVYLSAVGPKSTQDRWIIFTPEGTQQAIILTRPTLHARISAHNKESEEVFSLVEQSIRSTRSFSDLNPGRAWVNRELENIQLDAITQQTQPVQLRQGLARVQQLLLARISVEPASLDSYFHLAGTSTLLLKTLLQIDGENAKPYKLEGWGKTAAIQNLKAAHLYAQDIDPTDAKSEQIQGLWLDLQKKL